MSRKGLVLFSLLVIVSFINEKAFAQEYKLKGNYLGFIPSFLAEPYDTIDALEINILPFLYELRVGETNDVGFQIRPIVNYRFYEFEPGISQVGATFLVNYYVQNMLSEGHWLVPKIGIYSTYAYNRLDGIQTITLGIEPGAYMHISDHWSISIDLQPGINYYPDQASQDYVGGRFKSHLGVFFHVGYNF